MPETKTYKIYKPFGYLSQFSDPVGNKVTLGGLYNFPKDVYPVGRLDEDSEGLLILSNDPALNSEILESGMEKEYWVQVEGTPEDKNLEPLRKGILLRLKKTEVHTLPAKATIMDEPADLPERIPPIRFRKNIPTSWLSIIIKEGKNRQVRKMTAAIGFPTLRLLRVRIGEWKLENMKPGDVREID